MPALDAHEMLVRKLEIGPPDQGAIREEMEVLTLAQCLPLGHRASEQGLRISGRNGWGFGIHGFVPQK